MNRGEVYRVGLERTCVIVKRSLPADVEAKNPMTIVVPIADADGRSGNLLHIFVSAGVGGMSKASRILCQQIRAIDKRRIVSEKVGEMPAQIMDQVDAGLRAVLDL